MISCDGNSAAIRRCLTVGLFPNSAAYHSTGVYRTIRDDLELAIHPSSVLYTETPASCVLFGDVIQSTSKRHLMRDVTVIESSWLHELASHYFDYGTENELASKRSRFE
jgi:ATP-dependent RNA helicase DDX35